MKATEGDLVTLRPAGLYCPAGDFYIDPWRPVDRAVITHAHADHARTGHAHYLATARSEGVLRARLGAITLQPLAYGEAVVHRGVRISLHPAGHVLGSAQVRLEHAGRVWVASGDYFVSGASGTASAGGEGGTNGVEGVKGEARAIEDNLTCDPFEAVRCDCFITESTFGLPVYRWRPQHEVYADMNAWWSANADAGRASLLMGYSFGKAQRLLAGLDESIGPIVVHAAVEPLNRAYRAAGIRLPATTLLGSVADKTSLRRAIAVGPPSVQGSSWARAFTVDGVESSEAFASGWMQLRGARRRRGVDRGFVMSDHADWPGLQRAIAATGAERVIVTHGYEAVMVRWLEEQGLRAGSFKTEYGDRDDASGEVEADRGTAVIEPQTDVSAA
jgi:putative mRNA 3-end processing factor